MKRFFSFYSLIALTSAGAFFTINSAQAQETPSPVSAAAEFGFLSSNGNSDSQSVNANFRATYDLPQWKYQGALMGLSAATADPDVPGSELVTSAERYALDLQADRKLESDHSFFGKFNYDDDRFSGFEHEIGFVVGYGRQVIQSETQQFRIEIGPGYRVSKPDIGESQNEALLSTAFLFNQHLGETSAFNQSLLLEAGDERTISTSVTSLSAQIIGQLAMKLSLTMKHNSDPAFDENSIEKASVDKETSINLVYSF